MMIYRQLRQATGAACCRRTAQRTQCRAEERPAASQGGEGRADAVRTAARTARIECVLNYNRADAERPPCPQTRSARTDQQRTLATSHRETSAYLQQQPRLMRLWTRIGVEERAHANVGATRGSRSQQQRASKKTTTRICSPTEPSRVTSRNSREHLRWA